MATVYSPAAKLNVLHATFTCLNNILSQHGATLNSMDAVLPVFMAVVARAGVEHLGAEIQLLDDFVDMDSASGESKILLTTLRAAYYQLIKDYETEYVLPTM